MTEELSRKRCVPCEGGAPPLEPGVAAEDTTWQSA